MSKRSLFWALKRLARNQALALLLAASSSVAWTNVALSSDAARLSTYQNESGNTAFALSLMPNVQVKKTGAADILIMVDTSASQAGVFREDSFNALQAMLKGLGEADRVKLVAVDLEAVPLTEGFVAPNSPEMQKAIDALAKRAPLGSTDMGKVIGSAAVAFDAESKNPRNAVYIGDGVSKGKMLGDQFADLTKSLVDNKVSFSSFAIGAQRDVQMMAALANASGGNVFLDTDEANSVDMGVLGLVNTVRNAVIWPESANFPSEMTEVFPARVPPLRTDRDTILVGTIKGAGDYEVSISGEVGGEKVELKFPVKSEASDEEFSFLPKLVEMARPDQGATLPTVGSEGLREVQFVIANNAENLSKLGRQALAIGDKAGAEKLAGAALEADPTNELATAVKGAAGKASDPAEVVVIGPQENTGEDPVPADSGKFLKTAEQDLAVLNDKTRVEVQAALDQARKALSDDPKGAIEQMKILLDTVTRTPDLAPAIRSELRDKIVAAIKEGEGKRVEIEQVRAKAEEAEAARIEKQRLSDEASIREEKVDQLVKRFGALLREHKEVEAVVDVVPEVREAAPDTVISSVVQANGQFRENAASNSNLMRERRRAYLLTMLQVEKSMIPFPDDPAIVYPDPEFWDRITRLREKYKAVDLAGTDEQDKKILEALESNASFDYSEQPLADFVDELSRKYGIDVSLDTEALESEGVTSESPITKKVSGTTLRKAMRRILDSLEGDVTFIIKNGELIITSKSKADEYLVTKVYNVGDLVVQIPQFSIGAAGLGGFGGGFGGGGGGAGGGFGGGGGGFGGGGGGFGGGGLGGGGGGGLFALNDEIKLSDSKTEQSAEEEKKPAALKVEAAAGQSTQDAWDAYFQANQPAPADVRETVRDLMGAKKFDEVICVVMAALRQNQPQPWMYEGLALAMEANGSSKAELERALMSAVDFSTSLDDSMLAALYMSQIGLEKRALSIFQDVAAANPTRPEPYMQALRVAKRINDIEGIKWSCVGILSQNWPAEQKEIAMEALRVAHSTLQELKQTNKTEELKEFDAKLSAALVRDCIIKVTWTGEADIDLVVEEPAGTICSANNPRTISGGTLLGDEISLGEEKTVDGTSEYYVCTKAFPGDYRVIVQKNWGEVTDGKVTVEIIRNFRAKNETYQREFVEIAAKVKTEAVVEAAVVNFKLEEGRRADFLSEQQIAAVVRKQFNVNNAILGQQMSNYRYSDAARSYLTGGAGSPFRNPFLGRFPAVGYRPMITVLPEGAMTSISAVVSADRRYVRITPIPNFTQIVSVSTFNFVSGGSQNQGGGLGGGGGGGGFGGGFGGGGFL